jgi:hypothetical protein
MDALRSFGKEHVPSNMRLFASTMTGDRSPVDESYFPEKDLAAFRTAVNNSRQGKADAEKKALLHMQEWAKEPNPSRDLSSMFGKGATVGSMQQQAIEEYQQAQQVKPALEYNHYPDKVLGTLEQEGWTGMVGASFGRPGYRGATTIGSGNISQDEKGNTIISDTYDWNGGKQSTEATSLLDQLKMFGTNLGRPVALGNMLGNYLAPADGGNTRPVRLNLGKIPQ